MTAKGRIILTAVKTRSNRGQTAVKPRARRRASPRPRRLHDAAVMPPSTRTRPDPGLRKQAVRE
jgi:hypothetical protein